MLCATKPPAGFSDQLCIFRADSHECPAEYPTATAWFKKLSDTRGCNADCSCDASQVSCTGSVTAHGDTACSTQDPASLDQGVCFPTTTAIGSLQYVPDLVGSCTAVNGTPNGTVEGVGLITMCCR